MAYKDFINFDLLQPYAPTKIEAWAIYKAKNDWKSTRSGVMSFKENLKEFLGEQQRSLCVYCRIQVDKKNIEIEHIKPKGNSAFIHLTYNPSNLCLCCGKCNKHKGERVDLVIDPYKNLYLDYIDLKGDIVPVSTHKIYNGVDIGDNTIKICKLDEYENISAHSKFIIDNQLESCEQLIMKLSTMGLSSQLYDELLNQIETIKKNYDLRKQILGK